MTDKNINNEYLKKEIEKIAQFLSEAKLEIAAITLPEEKTGNEKNISHAELQLNEVIRSTEEATNTIMDKADAIMLVAGGLSDEQASAELAELAVGILEACSFQDITGQRIKKVLNTLEQIELRISHVVKLFGGVLPENLLVEDVDTGHRRADEALMAGPQLAKDKPTQDDVDKLFDSKS
jgi:chemotaxis protein CheZ